eukprot:s665_g1.t1
MALRVLAAPAAVPVAYAPKWPPAVQPCPTKPPPACGVSDPLASRRPVVLCLIHPADDGAVFSNARCVGHPDSLQALRGAGADVQVLRASCLCQGKRLLETGQVSELSRSGRTWQLRRCPGPATSAASCAWALSHLRAWLEATEKVPSGPVIILGASSALAASAPHFVPAWARQVIDTSAASATRGEPMLLLGPSLESGGTLFEGYSLSPALLRALRSQSLENWKVAANPTSMVSQLWQFAQAGVMRPMPCAGLLSGSKPVAAWPRPLRPPALVPGRPRDDLKVLLITLPHRSDRRIDPLIGGPAAAAALKAAGYHLEALRASCYCERDALDKNGYLPCYFSASLWGACRRYEGATEPLDSEDEEDLIDYINDTYAPGAERLIDPEDGTIAGREPSGFGAFL